MIKNLQGLLRIVVVMGIGIQFGNAQCDDVTQTSITNPGPYNVGTLTEADGLRNGPDYNEATVFYPINANPPYASIAIVPGFNAGPGAVRSWGPYYASHGIVAIVIGPNNISAFPDTRANALLDALETLRQENTRASSPLESKIDLDKFAVSGHSMGGGGAQRAAVLGSGIKAVIALNPWLLPVGNRNLNHQIPVLILSGQNDNTANPAQHATIHYNQTPNETTKLLYEVKNGNHSSAIGPSGAQGIVGKMAISWLRSQLDTDGCYCSLITDEFLDNPSTASQIQTNVSCATLSVNEIDTNILTTSIYPNPTDSFVTIQSDVLASKKYDIFSVSGKHVASGKINSSKEQIDLSKLQPNMYLLRIDNQIMKILKTK